MLPAFSPLPPSMASNPHLPPAIGIDLGTAYTCLAISQKENDDLLPQVIPNVFQLNKRSTASCVTFYPKGFKLVGDAAKEPGGGKVNVANIVYGVKRLIGRSFDDDEVLQEDLKRFTFNVINEEGKLKIRVQGALYTPEEITAMILVHLKAAAEKYLNTTLTEAVITVPAYFNDAQRAATKTAGQMAGFKVLQLLDEPVAAALAYGIDDEMAGSNVLVFDLGGRKLEITVLTVDENGHLVILASYCDQHLGGEDFDDQLANYLAAQYFSETGNDISTNLGTLRRLKVACEKAKQELYRDAMTDFALVKSGPSGIGTMMIQREQFEVLCEHLFERVRNHIRMALAKAQLTGPEIDCILLVGGSTRMTPIRRLLGELFNDSILNESIDPNEVIALGAAVQAAKLSGQNSEMVNNKTRLSLDENRTQHSLGLEVAGNQMAVLIPRNSPIPFSATRLFRTNIDNQTSILLQIYEGEEPVATENHLLCRRLITGIPSRLRVDIEITFDLDARKNLTVTIIEKWSGKWTQLMVKWEEAGLD